MNFHHVGVNINDVDVLISTPSWYELKSMLNLLHVSININTNTVRFTPHSVKSILIFFRVCYNDRFEFLSKLFLYDENMTRCKNFKSFQ